MIMALFINLTLNFILIKPYGVIGVAIATSLTMIIWNLTAVIIIKKNLKINSFYYPLNIKNAT
jgi:O-antigen/teichoic acid export membrane protein